MGLGGFHPLLRQQKRVKTHRLCWPGTAISGVVQASAHITREDFIANLDEAQVVKRVLNKYLNIYEK